MKTREDFVSNSSSCSFVINDINAFMKAFEKLSGTDTWWLYGLKANFTVDNSSENRRIFKDLIDQWTDTRGKELQFTCDLERLFCQIDADALKQMRDIIVYAYNDDGRDNVARETLLYWAMKSEGVDVDNGQSEREMALFNDVPAGIVNAAMTMFQPKQDLN